MGYSVKQGDIFGRVGSGLGTGLAEQLPEEMNRYRLKKGLEEVSQKQDQTPFQQFASLSSIPGITPQMIQSGAELLKHQGIRKTFADKVNPELGQNEYPPNSSKSNDFRNIQFGNLDSKNQMKVRDNFQSTVENPINQSGQPQIVERNPLRQEAVPAKPWTPERRDEEIARVFQENPYLTFPEAVQRAADNEARSLAQPAAEREQDEYFKGIQSELDNEFTKQLETKLQKSGEGVYSDITGEMINNMKREMSRELRTTPEANVKDIANKWTSKALDLAKTKSQLDKEANSNFFALPLLLNKNKLLNKLKSYQKIFHETGNDEEFFNNLKQKFTLSPQGAATIAYPLSKNVSSYMDGVKNRIFNRIDPIVNSRKRAVDIEDKITGSDSLLSIARSIKMKDPFFSEKDFFDQLRQDQDNLPLTARQKRELAEGESDILPHWGDILILPIIKGME